MEKSLPRGPCALAVLFGAIFVLMSHAPAKAHGEANWIMENPQTGWCCGPKDCFWIKPEEVRVDDEHYVVDRLSLRWPIIATYRSVDSRFWICIYQRGTADEEVKCLFAPSPKGM